MPSRAIACQPDLLRLSLEDKLPEQQEEELARHLSECASCQLELERLAAGRAEWSKVGVALAHEIEAERSHLAPQEAANPLAEREGRTAPFHAEAEEYTSADFAVDFLEPATEPETIGRLGDIGILEVIGHGGMGIVLKGYQRELNRFVAVKVLGPHLATSGPARKRFAREAQATAAILHPNVMPILTVSSSGKLPYLVMPYVSCESLQQRIDRAGALDTLDLLRIGMQTASGLAAAHAQGLVHRDIKPANILLERGVDRVMLTDFGLARAIDDASITRTGVIAGTPQFMSPEQAQGEPIDARSDLFSLGSVLYTLAAGRPPFRAESTYGILRRITDSSPRPLREVNPLVPDWLAAIVDKLLAKQAADRFATAEEVAALLEQCLAHVQQPGGVPLPAAVCALVKEKAIDTSANGKGQAHWARRVSSWGVVVGCGVVAAALATAYVDRNHWPHIVPKSSDEQYEGSSGTSPAERPETGTSAQADWDEGARQVESLRRLDDDFETRAGRLWDEESEESKEPRP